MIPRSPGYVAARSSLMPSVNIEMKTNHEKNMTRVYEITCGIPVISYANKLLILICPKKEPEGRIVEAVKVGRDTTMKVLLYAMLAIKSKVTKCEGQRPAQS